MCYKNQQHVQDSNYDVIEIDNVFTPQQCQEIIELSKEYLIDSTVWNNKKGKSVKDENSRISSQAWLSPTASRLVQKAMDVNEDLLRIEGVKKHGKVEFLQIVNYQKGGQFKPHYDAGNGSYGTNPEINNRYYTMLIYLNDNYTGGKTCFPKINKCITPKQGKVILFKNTDKNGYVIEQALHEGSPVEDGEKWIANLWTHL